MSGSVLLIGDPKLRVVSKEVPDVNESTFLEDSKRLKTVLDAFRKENGFGRYANLNYFQIDIETAKLMAPMSLEYSFMYIINFVK